MKFLCFCSEHINGDEGLQDKGQVGGVKISESDTMESDSQGKSSLRKNGSKTELPPPISEKDSLLAKSRPQTVKGRQTQSGPLMPGMVVGQSIPERARTSERCMTFSHCFIFSVYADLILEKSKMLKLFQYN